MKKRILSLLLSLVMVVSLLPVTALAANVDMSTYTGNRITEIVIKASVDTSKVPGATNSYTESRNFVVGDPVVNIKFRFEVDSLSYVQGTGGTTQKITDNFPISIGFGPYYREDNTAKWRSVISYVMPYYLAGQYCYDVSANVEGSVDAYRIAPNVSVKINWDGSSEVEECSTERWVCNETDRSLILVKTAPFTITDNGPLKLTPSLSIPSGYAKEAIKSFSVASWASGGTGSYTFSKVSGPEGINVSSDGTVSGAPTTACETEQTLRVKVRDSAGTEKTADIPVGAVKAERTVIQAIEIAGLDYPRVGDVVPKFPSVYVTKINGNAVYFENSPIRLEMRFWKDDNGDVIYNALVDEPNAIHTFMDGENYVFDMQVRLEGEETCAQYRLAEDLKVIVPSFTDGAEGHNTLTKTPDTSLVEEADYAYLCVSSPKWMPVNKENTLTGMISYSGAARYNRTLTANVNLSGTAATGVTESDLSYQWQYKATNGIWYDVYHNDTEKSITLNEALGVDKLVGRQLRVTVRCPDKAYTGTLYGDAVTVQKDWNMGTPVTPVIEYKDNNDRLEITSASWRGTPGKENQQEYVWTTEPSVDANGAAVWPAEGSSIVKKGNSGFLAEPVTDQTYYVYTRIKGSDTREPGRILRAAVFTVVEGGATSSATPARDMIYPDSASRTLTVYVEKGKSITVPYQLSPGNATSNLPRWKGTYTATNGTGASVTVANDTTGKKLTITAGDTPGTVDVIAYKSDSSTPYTEWWCYGTDYGNAGRQITVIVYDPADPASIPFAVTNLGTVNLTVGETYEINKEALRELNFVPEGVSKAGFTLAAAIPTYGTTGSITFSNSNEYIEVSSDTNQFSVEGKANSDTTTCEVAFYALPTADTAINNGYKIASLNVKVAPAVPATPITNAAVRVDEPMVTATVSNAVPAETEPNYTIDWTEWVDSDNDLSYSFELNKTYTVKVRLTAKAGYAFANDATFTVNGKNAAAPADFAGGNSVIVTYKFATPVHIHASLGFWSRSSTEHWQTCDTCGTVIQSTKADHMISWVTDKMATATEKGAQHEECMLCCYKTGETKEIPATGTSETPINPNPDKNPNPNPDKPSGGSGSKPSGTTATTTGTAKSADTGDAGIALYAALSLMSMTGGAWLVGKKRRTR